MPKLYKDDQLKVDEVLAKGIYSVERKPFRVWRLLLIIVGVLVLITVASYLIALKHGVI